MTDQRIKTEEEQIAEHEAKPFPVDEWGFLTSKTTAIVDASGAILRVMITAPYRKVHGRGCAS